MGVPQSEPDVAKANPTLQILRWARASSGYDTATVARRIGVDAARLEAWESGKDQPTFAQLRKLADVYKRPLAVFYLPEPPAGFSVMRDFRRLPGATGPELSPALRYQLRLSMGRRSQALELYEVLGQEPPAFKVHARMTEGARSVAGDLRRALGVTFAEQANWKQPYVAYGAWRSRIEEAGVLAFQVPGVALSETRGFSISEKPLPVVAVNSRDHVLGRIFTLAHEVTHIALRSGGVCTSPSAVNEDSAAGTEAFCNEVAGEMLVPRDDLLAQSEVEAGRGHTDWDEGILMRLARRFSVSREVVLRRLLELGRTTQAFYKKKREEFIRQATLRKEREEEEREGGPPIERTVLSRIGPTFASLVAQAYGRRLLTSLEVADHFDVKVPSVVKVLGAVQAGDWVQEPA